MGQQIAASGAQGNLLNPNMMIKYRDLMSIVCQAEDILPKIANQSFVSDEDVQCHREVRVMYDPTGLDWQPSEINGQPRYSNSSRRTACFKICNYIEAHRKWDARNDDGVCGDYNKKERELTIETTMRNLNGLFIQHVLNQYFSTIHPDNRGGTMLGTLAAPITLAPTEILTHLVRMQTILIGKQYSCELSKMRILVPAEFRILVAQSEDARHQYTCCDEGYKSGVLFKTIAGFEIMSTSWLKVTETATHYIAPILLINPEYMAFYGKVTKMLELEGQEGPTSRTLHMYATYGAFNIRPDAHVLSYIQYLK